MKRNSKFVYDKRALNATANTANGAKMKIECEGKIGVRIIPKQGKAQEGTLAVKVAPDLHVNLFSFIQAMKSCWQLEGSLGKDGQVMLILTHEDFSPIYLDRVIKQVAPFFWELNWRPRIQQRGPMLQCSEEQCPKVLSIK